MVKCGFLRLDSVKSAENVVFCGDTSLISIK